MKKHIYEESNRLSYTMHGDYYLPDLVVNEEEPTYGKYGMLRKQFLKEHRPARYQYLVMTGELTGHLNQVAQDAKEQVEILVKQMAEKQGVTEQMKMQDQMKWVGSNQENKLLAKGGNYMELSIQIKKYRTELHLSQEELAEKVYVTRQTISNWENEKSYPDIHSLLLLSSLFNVSLDQLIKGDIEKMKEIISEQEIKKFNYYGSIYTVHLAVLIISAVPLFMWLGRYAYIPFGILFIITMYWALKVEKLKKKNDIQTYKEIVAFTEGKKLDELHKAVEVGKRPYQNILKVIISAGVTAMICFLIGVLMHLFLN